MIYNRFHLYCNDCGTKTKLFILRRRAGFSSLTGKPAFEQQRRMACTNPKCPRYEADRQWREPAEPYDY
jgi:hypothetical protein